MTVFDWLFGRNMKESEYWIGKGIDYDSVWQAYESGRGYIEKYHSMRVHLFRVELAEFPANLPLFNHEAVYKTIKGYFHDFKQLSLTSAEYGSAGPLFLYRVDRGSGIWDFLGEPRPVVGFAAALAEQKVLGQELEIVQKKLDIIQRYFPGALSVTDLKNFMRAKSPAALRRAVAKLIEQGIRQVAVSQEPFNGNIREAEKSLIDFKQLILGDLNMRDKITADRGGQAAGGEARITNRDFQQYWTEIKEKTDIGALAKELAKLHSEMSQQAKLPDELVATGQVAAAAAAAKSGDGPGALQYLKAAGKWTFDFTTKVGASLVAAVMKEKLGY